MRQKKTPKTPNRRKPIPLISTVILSTVVLGSVSLVYGWSRVDVTEHSAPVGIDSDGGWKEKSAKRGYPFVVQRSIVVNGGFWSGYDSKETTQVQWSGVAAYYLLALLVSAVGVWALWPITKSKSK